MTRQQFAAAFAVFMGWPSAIIPGLVAVMVGEDSEALCNAFDDERAMPGSTNYNPQGVQNYVSVPQAFAAYAATLTASRYAGVIVSAKAGAPRSFVNEWALSGWGTWSSTSEAQADLALVQSDPSLSLVIVAGTIPTPEVEEMKLIIGSAGEGQPTYVVAVPGPNGTGTPWKLQVPEPADVAVWEQVFGATAAVLSEEQLALIPTVSV